MTKIKITKKRVITSKFAKTLPIAEREVLPAHIDVPAEPSYAREGDEKHEHEEQQVARVELMMTKGVRAKRTLMALLDIRDGRAMDRYIRRVFARWEMLGTTQDFARHRGEGLNRLDVVESELWSKMSNLDPKTAPTAALNYLQTILKVQETRNDLLGLTPKVIAHIGSMTDDGEVSRRIVQQDRLAQVAQRIQQMIQERTTVIDHVPSETP